MGNPARRFVTFGKTEASIPIVESKSVFPYSDKASLHPSGDEDAQLTEPHETGSFTPSVRRGGQRRPGLAKSQKVQPTSASSSLIPWEIDSCTTISFRAA